MTAFLASVRCEREARIALEAGADIIDAKEPGDGALGAVSGAVLARIIDEVAGARPVSATIGDLPMRPELIASAVRERSKLGAEYIKFGVFDERGAIECARAASAVSGQAKIIVVLFADLSLTQAMVSPEAMVRFAKTGVAGVMLDTANKSSGGLPKHFDLPALSNVISAASSANLLCGLAGALQIHDIQKLVNLRPGFLGFRGALCASGIRAGALDADRARSISGLVRSGAAAVEPDFAL